jgi:hypothetical protein
MKQIQLRETIFQVEKLSNVVGIGNSAAYQVVIAPGRNVGNMGEVIEMADVNSHNDAEFSNGRSFSLVGTGLRAWLNSSLSLITLGK